MKTFNEFLEEAEVSGDSGGSSADLSAGINSGNVVRGNPQTLGKAKRKKPLADAGISYAKAGLPEKGLPSNEDLKEANISKAVMAMRFKSQKGKMKIDDEVKASPQYNILIDLGLKPKSLSVYGRNLDHIYELGGKPDYDDITELLSKKGWKFIKDIPDSEKDEGNWESLFSKSIKGVTYFIQVRDLADGRFLMDISVK